jgi:hypothetical protein
MITRGFMETPVGSNDPWWYHKRIDEMGVLLKPVENNIIDDSVSCSAALELMRERQLDCFVLFGNSGSG